MLPVVGRVRKEAVSYPSRPHRLLPAPGGNWVVSVLEALIGCFLDMVVYFGLSPKTYALIPSSNLVSTSSSTE